MSKETFQERWDYMQSWSRILADTVERTLPSVQASLDPETALPEGCSSRVSLALREFEEIRRVLREFDAALKLVEGHLRGFPM